MKKLLICLGLMAFSFNGICMDKGNSLMQAASVGNVSLVKKLLKKGVDIDAKDKADMTALMRAASEGHVEIVKMLLATGKADVNAFDKYNKRTPLMWAAYNGHADVLSELLNNDDVYINDKDSGGYTALMLAAENGHVEIVKMLLATGKADVNAFDKYKKRTAIIWAAYNGYPNVVSELLNNNDIYINDKDSGGYTALMHAAWKGNDKIVKMLIDKGAETYPKDNLFKHNALMIAASRGFVSVVGELLTLESVRKNINDVSRNNLTALMLAARGGHQLVVRMLMNGGASVDAQDNQGMTALMLAASKGYFSVVMALLGKEDTDIMNKNAFELVAYFANNKSMQNTSDVKDRQEQTVLTVAANVNVQDKRGRTAIMYAAEQGNLEILRELIAANADINAKDREGGTAFMYAARVPGYDEDDDTTVDEEQTARKVRELAAAEQEHLKILEALVASNADIHAKDSEGKTALDYASTKRIREYIERLK